VVRHTGSITGHRTQLDSNTESFPSLSPGRGTVALTNEQVPENIFPQCSTCV